MQLYIRPEMTKTSLHLYLREGDKCIDVVGIDSNEDHWTLLSIMDNGTITLADDVPAGIGFVVDSRGHIKTVHECGADDE